MECHLDKFSIILLPRHKQQFEFFPYTEKTQRKKKIVSVLDSEFWA